ncbi:MAG TPA: gamma-glutamyltransferase [Thermoanaerobaculia bacterium]|nr:gamma-glutamyltransferase [Thermoanaerobaculia bacterium]
MRRRRGGIAALLSFLVAAAAHAGSTIEAANAALSTASPLATKAGLDVLRRGGNAIDAAVAVAFALAVVHPQAGNIGGGGFLLYYDAGTGDVWALDFRETAPRTARRDMFQMPDGAVAPEIRTGPGSAAVPGTVAGLAAAHERFGSRPWQELLAPAVAIAREGIRVDAEMERELRAERDARKIDRFSTTAAVFFPEGKPAAARSRLVQTDLAATLERIAAGGADDFYRGETARRLVNGVRAAGGSIGERDLREYQPVWRSPLKIRFRDYEIYTMPPPSGGGLVLAAALNILAGYDLSAAGFQTPLSVHLLAEATRRAYIDRNRYIGDPASTRIPFGRLLSPERAEQWRSSIDVNRATPTITLASPGAVAEGTHTTHFTIVDREGNIVALTTTLNENFGSGFVVPDCGFFLNNAMQDFLAAPGKPDRTGLVAAAPNAIEPGKRMASSMTPAIIFQRGRPLLALGTRGGPAIPTTLLQVFLNIAIHGKSVAEAVAAPRFHHQSAPERLDFESGRTPQPLLDALHALGHGVNPRERIGDVHAVAIHPDRIVAVADPRRGGAAGGL